MTYRRLKINRAHRNICKWILQHEFYSKWTTNERELFWFKKKPEFEKSILLAFIYQKFTRRSICKRVIYFDFFFHARGAFLQKTFENMFRSLLHQMFKQCHVVKSRVRTVFMKKKTFDKHEKNWNWHARKLKNLIFNAVIRVVDSYIIIIFINALNEIDAKITKKFMTFFHRLKDEAITRNGNLKICIFCRHYFMILKSVCPEICVENENRQNISIYVLNKFIFDDLNENLKSELTYEWHAFAKNVIEKTSKIFQWTKLVIFLINQLQQKNESLSYIKKKLAQISKNLKKIYEHIFTNVIETQNRFRTLFMMQWICFAVQSLSMTKLRFAMISDRINCHELMHFCQNENILKKKMRR